MAEVLVLVEHAEGALKKVSAELITAARVLGEPSAVVVGAPGTAAALTDGFKAAGAAKIYVAESDDVDSYLVTPRSTCWPRWSSPPPRRACCWPPAPTARRSPDGWPRGSARVCWSTSSRSRRAAVGVHSIFGGAFTVEAEAAGDTPVITVRPGADRGRSRRRRR